MTWQERFYRWFLAELLATLQGQGAEHAQTETTLAPRLGGVITDRAFRPHSSGMFRRPLEPLMTIQHGGETWTLGDDPRSALIPLPRPGRVPPPLPLGVGLPPYLPGHTEFPYVYAPGPWQEFPGAPHNRWNQVSGRVTKHAGPGTIFDMGPDTLPGLPNELLGGNIRALAAQRPLGAPGVQYRYPNLAFATFRGVPIPLEGDVLHVRKAWVGNTPAFPNVLSLVAYDSPVTVFAPTGGGAAWSGYNKPVPVLAWPSGPSGTIQQHGERLEFDMPATITMPGTAAFGHFEGYPIDYASSVGTITPHIFFNVRYYWTPPVAPETMGLLRVQYRTELGYKLDYVMSAIDGGSGASTDNQAYGTNRDQDFGLHYFEDFYRGFARQGFDASSYDFTGRCATPPDVGNLHTYALSLIFDDSYNLIYSATVTETASAFGSVLGSSMTGAVLKGFYPGLAIHDDAVSGYMRFAMPLDLIPETVTYHDFTPFPPSKPIMYSGPEGQIPRPASGASATFCGLPITDGDSADAAMLNGRLYGIVANASEVAISIEGVEVYRQPTGNWTPDGIPRNWFQNTRFLMPDWLLGPVTLDRDYILRPVASGDRAGVAWHAGPRPPLVFAYSAPEDANPQTVSNLAYATRRGGAVASATGSLASALSTLNQPVLGESGASERPASVLGSGTLTFSPSGIVIPSELSTTVAAVLIWFDAASPDDLPPLSLTPSPAAVYALAAVPHLGRYIILQAYQFGWPNLSVASVSVSAEDARIYAVRAALTTEAS